MAGMDTAAMESLLEALLKQSQAQGRAQADAMAKLAKSAGLDPKVIIVAQNSVKGLGDASEDSSKKVSTMGKAGRLVGNVLGDLTSGIAATGANLAGFAAKAASGESKMSDLFAAFKDLPIIGVVAGLFAGLQKMQEANMVSYRDLANAGINFGGSLSSLRQDAASLGLDLNTMTKQLTTNADVFMLMGKSVNDGARNFKNLNESVVKSGGSLMNLGFNFEDMSVLTASYVRVQGGLSKQQLADQAKITAGIQEYGKELDLIARLTGQSREQQQKALEAEMQEANFQAWFSTQSEETKKKITTNINEAMAVAGTGGAQIVKAQAMGIAVQGQAGQMLTALAGNMANTLKNGTKDAMNTNISSAEYSAGTAKRVGTAQWQMAQSYKPLMTTMNALAQNGDKVADTIGPMAKSFAAVNNAGDKSLEATIARAEGEKQIADRQAKVANTQLDDQLAGQKALMAFNEQMTAVSTMLMNEVLSPVLRMIIPYIPKAGQAIKDFMEYFVPKLFSPEGRTQLLKDLGDGIMEILKAVAKVIGEKGFDQSEGNSGFQNTMNGINKFLPTYWALRALGIESNTVTPAPKPNAAPADATPRGGRSFASYGSTGKAFEDFGNGTPLTGHGIEGMFTPDDINKLMAASSANSTKVILEQLNNTNQALYSVMREVADYSRRNVEATKSLSGNAFA